MTVQERIKDLQHRTGLSEEVIRQVLEAETKSIIDSLAKGEKATVIGRCTFTPVLVERVGYGGVSAKHIRVTAKASARIVNNLFMRSEFEPSTDESLEDEVLRLDSDIRTFQIEELA